GQRPPSRRNWREGAKDQAVAQPPQEAGLLQSQLARKADDGRNQRARPPPRSPEITRVSCRPACLRQCRKPGTRAGDKGIVIIPCIACEDGAHHAPDLVISPVSRVDDVLQISGIPGGDEMTESL